tara:strand:- start:287 stop:592 length:306 start_codon:yes stop_codon:yes gene_type:complete
MSYTNAVMQNNSEIKYAHERSANKAKAVQMANEAIQQSKNINNTKHPKVVFNLGDVNKAPVLTREISDEIMHFQKSYKEYSLYMVVNASLIVEIHNFRIKT